MENDLNSRHLNAEGIQAFLEGELPPGEADALEEHASSCARCERELEAWRLLFAELGEMARLAPAPGFRARVMEEVQVRAPLLERLKGWLVGRGTAARGAVEHLSPGRLQDYVEGILPQGQMARVRSHLEECGRCRRQEAAWQSVFQELGTLPRVEPSPGFARSVMDRVEVPVASPARARPSPWDRAVAGIAGWLHDVRPAAAHALAMARKLRPRTRRAWALVGSALAAPGVVMAAAALYVATNPLLSVTNLSTFLWWRVSEATVALTRSTASALLESSVATRGYALLEPVVGSPSLAAGTAAALCVLTVVSLYVLYRNLIATRPVERRYVHFSF